MKVLVIGGNGFLGANLVNSLSFSYKVVAGVREISKKTPLSNTTNELVINWDNLSSNKNNLLDFNTIIYAAGVNAFDCIVNPDKAFEINGDIPGQFIKIASDIGVKNFIYFSTAHVYSPNLSRSIDELSPTGNNHPYAQSHLMGESNILRHSNSNKINSLVIRLSNGFGVPLTENKACWSLVVNQMCQQAVESHQITINSTGTQRRNFIGMNEVGNVTKHLLCGMQENIKNEVFNVGSQWNPSILELAKTIQSRCREILNFIPEIIVKNNSCDKGDAIFSVNKLVQSNYNISNPVIEIDNLLRFCNLQL